MSPTTRWLHCALLAAGLVLTAGCDDDPIIEEQEIELPYEFLIPEGGATVAIYNHGGQGLSGDGGDGGYFEIDAYPPQVEAQSMPTGVRSHASSRPAPPARSSRRCRDRGRGARSGRAGSGREPAVPVPGRTCSGAWRDRVRRGQRAWDRAGQPERRRARRHGHLPGSTQRRRAAVIPMPHSRKADWM